MMTKGSFGKRMKGHHDLSTMREIKTPLDLRRITPANRGNCELPPPVNRKEIDRYVEEEKRRFAKNNRIVEGVWKRMAQKVLKNQAILSIRYQLQRAQHGAFGVSGAQPLPGKLKTRPKAPRYRAIKVTY